MPSVTLAGRSFNYGIEGNGEPIVHILGGEPTTIGHKDHVTNTGIPKIGQYLIGSHQIIYYNNFRPGEVFYATKADSPTDVDRVADDCYLLMQHLNIPKAHFFAHSLLSYAPLKLALEHPDLVKSISFIEFRVTEPLLLRPKAQAAMAQVVQRQMNN